MVAYRYADTGEVIGWQTPVAYVSYMPADIQRELTWELYDANGHQLEQFGLQPPPA